MMALGPQFVLHQAQGFGHICRFKPLDVHTLDLYHPKIFNTDIGHNIVVRQHD